MILQLEKFKKEMMCGNYDFSQEQNQKTALEKLHFLINPLGDFLQPHISSTLIDKI